MNNDQILAAIDNFPVDHFENLQTIGIQKKIVDGHETDQLALTFGVKSKLDKETISPDQLLPDRLTLGDTDMVTDVVEDNTEWEFEPAGCPYNASSTTDQHRQLTRPLKGGVSVGIGTTEHRFKMGTLGMLLVDAYDNQVVAITNNHVAVPGMFTTASDQSDTVNYSKVDVYQPSPAESGGSRRPEHLIGHVKRVYPIKSNISNEIDAAVIHLNSDVSIDQSSGSLLNLYNNAELPEQIDVLPVASSTEIDNLYQEQTPLFKSSRTTGAFGSNFPIDQAAEQSKCSIRASGTAYTLRVSGKSFKNIIKYHDPNITNRIDPSTGGDSGSIICGWLDGQWKAVGLHFAGSKTAGVDQGLMCRIDRVMELLNLQQFNPGQMVYGQTQPVYKVVSGYSNQVSIVIDGDVYWQVGRTTDDVNTEASPDDSSTYQSL